QSGPRTPDKAILLVEEREDDVLLVLRAFRKAGVPNPIRAVSDGEEAMSYLLGIDEYSERLAFPFPHLVLLDLKMPKTNGFEVLRWIRSLPVFKALPVIVLTCSEDIFDVIKAYELGANSFLVKPFEFENYTALAGTLAKFWFELDLAPAPVEEHFHTGKFG